MGPASESIFPEDGDDTVHAGGGDDAMFADADGDGADVFDGGAGSGDVSYEEREERSTPTSTASRMTGRPGRTTS